MSGRIFLWMLPALLWSPFGVYPAAGAAAGRAAFENLPDGEFTLAAEKDGFVRGAFGSASASLLIPIALAQGRRRRAGARQCRTSRAPAIRTLPRFLISRPASAARSRFHTFQTPGRYLVICTFIPHLDLAMYGWVEVRARTRP